jgi:WD40 repeat protein
VSEYDRYTGKLLSTIQADTDAVLSRVETHTSRHTKQVTVWATNLANGYIYHWAADGSLLSLWSYGGDVLKFKFYDLLVDPTERYLIVAESSNVVWLDIATGSVVYNYTISASDVSGLTAASDGTLYAVGLHSGVMYLWEPQSQRGKSAIATSARSA